MGKIEKGIDGVVIEYGEADALLQGRISVLEACRDWARRDDVKLPSITMEAAANEFKLHCAASGKSKVRLKEVHTVMDSLKEAFHDEVQTLRPKMIADYLTALSVAERTRRNYRNMIGYFNRWLVLRGYLHKGTDLLDGVQKYSARWRCSSGTGRTGAATSGARGSNGSQAAPAAAESLRRVSL